MPRKNVNEILSNHECIHEHLYRLLMSGVWMFCTWLYIYWLSETLKCPVFFLSSLHQLTTMGKITNPSKNDSSLTVQDNRTGNILVIPYVIRSPFRLLAEAFGRYLSIANNSIPATAFKSISAARNPNEREEDASDKGLRVFDQGFLNTAVMRSEITYIDGDAGGEYILHALFPSRLTSPCSSSV